MAFNPSLEEVQKEAKAFIDANEWDGEDRSGCSGDGVCHTPDELQALIDEMLEHLSAKGFL